MESKIKSSKKNKVIDENIDDIPTIIIKLYDIQKEIDDENDRQYKPTKRKFSQRVFMKLIEQRRLLINKLSFWKSDEKLIGPK